MKTITILILNLITSYALADNYDCKDTASSNIAYLTVTNSSVHWNEEFHSASSRALGLGIEGAPYSDLKGYQLFRLTDFFMTADSSNILAISPSLMQALPTGKVTTYFDNDGHEEEVTNYNCRKQNR